jgi:SAM-dependent methyltransferase
MLTYLLAYDFGYTLPWTHGHLIAAICLAAAAWLLARRKWRWTSRLLWALAAWALAGFLVIQFVFGFNRPMNLPAQSFMSANTGRVLDLGAGSGRASVMVGLARPGVRVVGLDNFSAQYIEGNGPDLFMKNMRMAGMEKRAEILSADMRKIPAPDESYDAVVSSYAIDHLSRQGIEQTLGEVRRVLRARGEFLMIVFRPDFWLSVPYGPIPGRHIPRPEFWRTQLAQSGLDILEEGTLPGTIYFYCRKKDTGTAILGNGNGTKEADRR